MINPYNLIQKQQQQRKVQRQRSRREQQMAAEKMAAEQQRKATFSKLLEGKICTREELETMQKKHQMYKENGHYISVIEKDSKGFNIQPKEFMDIYYIPIPTLMAEIKILKKSFGFAERVPKKEEMLPLEQKYFQSTLLKYCFTEIRSAIRRNYENNKPAIQKLILGKYSFEQYLNYEQRMSVSTKGRKCIVAEDIDISVVPVPELPVPVVHRETVEVEVINVSEFPVPIVPIPIYTKSEEPVKVEVFDIPAGTVPILPIRVVYPERVGVDVIIPRKPMIIHPIGFYQNPMDYYLNIIQWCRHCAYYDNCPEALQEAIFELMGNEGKYKEVFSNPTEMLQFIQSSARKHQYFIMCLGGEEAYENFMTNYIAENGRYLIMQKVTRMLGHWGLSQKVKSDVYLALKDHIKVTHQQIKEMYSNPRVLARWLKAFIPKSYITKDVDAAMARHGFYYY